MKLESAFLVLALFSFSSDTLARDVDPIHRKLCKVAVQELPKEIKSIQACLRDYPLEDTYNGKEIQIYSCIYGQLFHVFFDEATQEVSIAGEGAECD